LRFEVSVLAGQPNANVTGEAFQSAGGDQRRGVSIERVRHTSFDKARFWTKACNLLSFWCAAACRSLRLQRPDIVVAEPDPPLLSLLGWLPKNWFGCRLVVYLQGLYPYVCVAL